MRSHPEAVPTQHFNFTEHIELLSLQHLQRINMKNLKHIAHLRNLIDTRSIQSGSALLLILLAIATSITIFLRRRQRNMVVLKNIIKETADAFTSRGGVVNTGNHSSGQNTASTEFADGASIALHVITSKSSIPL
ncbi:uncharacterized protein LOC118754872 [Rhagoletis pomonella]|uniref:uncharacterized protein LOC118754872 n=1 Tax=Rhagoletis pomonella TaxID=28610 RepID=UPI00177CC4E5|nr:uncharacterized protein LOC118754872 [Rhagoletis pomonella]